MADIRAARRHDMVWLAKDAWPAVLAQQTAASCDEVVRGWAAARRPLVVRADQAGHDDATLAVGLPLPPEFGKRRLALRAPAAAVMIIAPPPTLHEAAIAAPVSWSPAIDRLLKLEPDARVFGSLAWEHRTGLRYLSPTSDLDLFLPHRSGERTQGLLAALAVIAADAVMAIDAEIVAANGDAVHWRELASGADDVLVKTRSGGLMIARTAFLQCTH